VTVHDKQPIGHTRCAGAALALCLLPSLALANSGTPLMWVGGLHLVFGNLFIGAAEGWLVARLLKVPKTRAIVAMIAANYASAWAGSALLPEISIATGKLLGGATLLNIGSRLGVLVGSYFVLTVLIELPFVWLTNRAAPARRVVRAALIVNLASYAALAMLYWSASGHSLLTSVSRTASLDWAASNHADWVYYIDHTSEGLMRVRADGTDTESLEVEIPAYSKLSSRSDWMHGGFLAARSEGNGLYTIRSDAGPSAKNELADLAVVCGPSPGSIPRFDPARVRGDQVPPTALEVGTLRPPPAQGADHIRGGFWPVEGIHVLNEDGTSTSVAWEMPFEAWAARSITELESGLASLERTHSESSIRFVVANFTPATLGWLAMPIRSLWLIASERT